MTKEEKQEYLEKISFSNLVKAINEKWSHAYIDPPQEEGLEFFFDIETKDSSL